MYELYSLYIKLSKKLDYFFPINLHNLHLYIFSRTPICIKMNIGHDNKAYCIYTSNIHCTTKIFIFHVHKYEIYFGIYDYGNLTT